MTKRERVLAAIQHKQIDRIPTTYRASGYLTESVMNYFQIAEPKSPAKRFKTLLEKVRADFWSSGSKVDKYSTFIPEFRGEKPKPPYVDDKTYFYTIGIHAKPGNMTSFDIEYPAVGVDPPLAGAQSPSDIPNGYLTSKLELFNFRAMKNKYRNISFVDIREDPDSVVCIGTLSSLFMMCCYLRGMEDFLADLAYNKKLAERLVREVGEFTLEFNRRELESCGKDALYYGTWDDVAGQGGMMFSPDQFKQYFLPIYKKLIEQNARYGLFFGWHVCGSVHEVLPLMIEAGIDVFDVVQTSAKDMAIENIHRLYGNNVCIHGGIDVQKVLVEKTAREIREEVKKIKDLWGRRGGVILAPSHETLPDTPIENILAIYEELHDG